MGIRQGIRKNKIRRWPRTLRTEVLFRGEALRAFQDGFAILLEEVSLTRDGHRSLDQRQLESWGSRGSFIGGTHLFFQVLGHCCPFSDLRHRELPVWGANPAHLLTQGTGERVSLEGGRGGALLGPRSR